MSNEDQDNSNPVIDQRTAEPRDNCLITSDKVSVTHSKDIHERNDSANNHSQDQEFQPASAKIPGLIVGIGASAGGLHPLQDFFKSLDPTLGHTYIVVQHLSPNFKSLMNELLGRETRMEVHRIKHGMQLAANAVYLIPPGTNLTIKGHTLYLEERQPNVKSGPQFPIDILLRSLARSAKSKAVAVILSGTGSDGSRGVRAIDEAGGLVYVQDPSTAQFDGMPNAARDAVNSHLLLSPEEIASSIGELTRDSTRLRHDPGAEALPPDAFDQIISLVSDETNNDFSAYKVKTISRRVQRRLVINAAESLEHYLEMLAESKTERKMLAADLLIGVTNFFRDKDAWESIAEDALPKLVDDLPPGLPLRIWVSACSPGEEVYTLAMIAQEALERAGKEQNGTKIFATDADQAAIDKAAAGTYPESIVADVPAQMLSKYFTNEGENYRVSRPLREKVIFAPHNLLTDAPFARMHMVTCRNVLIYFQPEAQKKVLSMLHFSLIPNGLLMLGASESVRELESEFKPVSQQWCIFSKVRDVRTPIQTTFRARPLSPKSNTLRSTSVSRESMIDIMIRDALQTIALARNWVCLICDSPAWYRRAWLYRFVQHCIARDVNKSLSVMLVYCVTGTMNLSICR